MYLFKKVKIDSKVADSIFFNGYFQSLGHAGIQLLYFTKRQYFNLQTGSIC